MWLNLWSLWFDFLKTRLYEDSMGVQIFFGDVDIYKHLFLFMPIIDRYDLLSLFLLASYIVFSILLMQSVMIAFEGTIGFSLWFTITIWRSLYVYHGNTMASCTLIYCLYPILKNIFLLCIGETYFTCLI